MQLFFRFKYLFIFMTVGMSYAQTEKQVYVCDRVLVCMLHYAG